MIHIPYGRQHIAMEDIKAVTKVLKSNFLTQGPIIKEFETKLAHYCGVGYAVAFSSGTAALHGACWAAGIKPQDEVITTPFTFAASANCVLYCGGKPVFADVRRDIPLIDPNEIEKKITSKTRGIISVDYTGLPADYKELQKLARQHKLFLIADASHSLGALYKVRKVGSLADMTVFSFHPVKLITTGEGGMVVTNNKKLYERLLLFRTHGITKDSKLLKRKQQGPWYYEMQELGFNYRLSDVHAALGISQFNKINIFLKKRQKIAEMYQKAFQNFDGVETLIIPSGVTCAWHLFPIFLRGKKLINRKKKLVEELHRKGIKVQVHYIPIHTHPFYQKLGYNIGDFPNSEEFYSREISLPMYPGLTNEDVSYVITGVKYAIGKFTSNEQVFRHHE